MNTEVDMFYAMLGSVIKREDSIRQRKENLLALWEVRKKFATPNVLERGDFIANNLAGTPPDCIRGKSLMDDLDWMLSKINQ